MYPDILFQVFQEKYKETPSIIVAAPGRINLIGEHTDYNDGFVLPAAIDKAIYFAASVRNDDQCFFYAHDLNEYFQTSISALEKTTTQTWANYLMGVIDEVQKHLTVNKIQGINLVFGGDLASGSGISSSAAIENGIGFVFNELFELGLSRLDLVRISQRAENNFVGMNCGIMDMFASMMGKENTVIQLDCRDLSYQYFPFETDNYCLVLCNSTIKHTLVDSEYNTRRKECEEGVAALQAFDANIRSLRDVSFDFLHLHKNQLREVVFRRCKYVVEEIERVKDACNALGINDFQQLGQLMFATHEGLSKEYEVSCEEIDFLVHRAQQCNEVLGARIMGGGFGGCTINLVQKNKAQHFITTMQTAYQEIYNLELPCHIITPKQGVYKWND